MTVTPFGVTITFFAHHLAGGKLQGLRRCAMVEVVGRVVRALPGAGWIDLEGAGGPLPECIRHRGDLDRLSRSAVAFRPGCRSGTLSESASKRPLPARWRVRCPRSHCPRSFILSPPVCTAGSRASANCRGQEPSRGSGAPSGSHQCADGPYAADEDCGGAGSSSSGGTDRPEAAPRAPVVARFRPKEVGGMRAITERRACRVGGLDGRWPDRTRGASILASETMK